MEDLNHRAKTFATPLRALSYEEKKAYVHSVLIPLINDYPEDEELYRFVRAAKETILPSFREQLSSEVFNRKIVTYCFALFILLSPGATYQRNIGEWIGKTFSLDRRSEDEKI